MQRYPQLRKEGHVYACMVAGIGLIMMLLYLFSKLQASCHGIKA